MAAPTHSVSLAEKFGRFAEHWSPKVVGEFNDLLVKVVKAKGEFIWHKHEEMDEPSFAAQIAGYGVSSIAHEPRVMALPSRSRNGNRCAAFTRQRGFGAAGILVLVPSRTLVSMRAGRRSCEQRPWHRR